MKLEALTPAHVRWFSREKMDRGLSGATVHKMHGVLHKALDQAVRDALRRTASTSRGVSFEVRLSCLLGNAFRSGLALCDGDVAGLVGDPLQPGTHRREPTQVEAPLGSDVRVGV